MLVYGLSTARKLGIGQLKRINSLARTYSDTKFGTEAPNVNLIKGHHIKTMSTTTNHHLVVTQAGVFSPPIQFTAPPGINLTQEHFKDTTPDQLHERIHKASIIVMCWTRLDSVALSEAVTPNLKFIAVTAVGTDSVDLETCRRRGILVSNCPAANVESVSNHAMALYFAARRNVVQMDRVVKDGVWHKEGPSVALRMKDSNQGLGLTSEEETVGIIGFGSVGKYFLILSVPAVADQKQPQNRQESSTVIQGFRHESLDSRPEGAERNNKKGRYRTDPIRRRSQAQYRLGNCCPSSA
jgi:hypothetical protein